MQNGTKGWFDYSPVGKNAKFGTVKWWNDPKGCGFITPDDGSADVFVHHTNLTALGTLVGGARVTYVVRANHKGEIQATTVVVHGSVG